MFLLYFTGIADLIPHLLDAVLFRALPGSVFFRRLMVSACSLSYSMMAFFTITLFIYSYVFPRKFLNFLVNINLFFFEKHSSVHYFICKTSIDMNDTSFCRYT